MKVFVIYGKAGHGKTTFGNILEEYWSDYGHGDVLRIAFGDVLKYVCSKYFEYDGVKDERGRSILQQVGTDVVRKHYPTFWADFVAKLSDSFVKEQLYDCIIIDDLRFPEEIEAIEKIFSPQDVITIKLVREAYNLNTNEWEDYKNPHMSEENLNHPSENALKHFTSNYIIVNHSIAELIDSAHVLLEDIDFS